MAEIENHCPRSLTPSGLHGPEVLASLGIWLEMQNRGPALCPLNKSLISVRWQVSWGKTALQEVACISGDEWSTAKGGWEQELRSSEDKQVRPSPWGSGEAGRPAGGGGTQGCSLRLSVCFCGGVEGFLSQRYEAEVRIQVGSWLLAPGRAAP